MSLIGKIWKSDTLALCAVVGAELSFYAAPCIFIPNYYAPYMGSWNSKSVYEFKDEAGRNCQLIEEDNRFARNNCYVEVEGLDLPITEGEIKTEGGHLLVINRESEKRSEYKVVPLGAKQ